MLRYALNWGKITEGLFIKPRLWGISPRQGEHDPRRRQSRDPARKGGKGFWRGRRNGTQAGDYVKVPSAAIVGGCVPIRAAEAQAVENAICYRLPFLTGI